MIVRLLASRLNVFLFSAAGHKVVKGKMVADMPQIEFATKPKPKEDERLSLNVATETMSKTVAIKIISEKIDFQTVAILRSSTETVSTTSSMLTTMYFSIY